MSKQNGDTSSSLVRKRGYNAVKRVASIQIIQYLFDVPATVVICLVGVPQGSIKGLTIFELQCQSIPIATR